MNARATARRLLERTGSHPVISLYFDLDPEQFATAPARATQARSLLDEAARKRGNGEVAGFDHQDRVALERDLARLEEYLGSDEPPVSGARALAVFASSEDELFEAVPLDEPTEPRVVIARTPYVEPLLVRASQVEGAWCVTLVNRREARIFEGEAEQLNERRHVSDDVHGQHDQGGWSQANYQRSYEQDVEAHLQHVAEELRGRFERRPFATLVLGGPAEVVSRFEEHLHGDLKPLVNEERLSLDVATAGEDEVREAVAPLLERHRQERRSAALQELSARSATATGAAETTRSLTERRVETLILSRGFQAAGGRCPSCGLLTEQTDGACPTGDGGRLERVKDLREAMIESAVLQDADVVVLDEEEVPGEVAALLRF